jgi:hypothetical protein
MLPSHVDDFKCASFWDGFFVARGPAVAAFEWYCAPDDLWPFLARALAGGAAPVAAITALNPPPRRSLVLHVGASTWPIM